MPLTTQRSDPPDESPADPDAGGVAADPPEDTVELPLDVVFDLLSNERRRRVLRYLEESDPTTLSDLAEHIASIENDKPVRELSSSERKRVYICLYQCHLPKLDDAGVIDFDEHRKSVTAGANLDPVAAYLPSDDAPAEPPSTTPQHYLGLSFAGFAALAVQQAIAPAGWLTGLLLGALLATVGAMAFGHRRSGDALLGG